MSCFKVLFVMVFIFSSFFLNAQNQKDSIKIGYNIYSQNGFPLNLRQIRIITRDNELALNEIIKAENYNAASFSFAFAGGAMIGWPIGGFIRGEEFNWKLALAGLGFVFISYPFETRYRKHLLKGVQIYNSGLQKKSGLKTDIHFGLSPGGLGIKFKF